MPNEDSTKEQKMPEPTTSPDLIRVVEKINDAESILVTLSKDPSVDEIAAAIGLSLMLSKMGKHTTAIYSGKTPNTVEFLEPEKTFETNTNSLQDFIVALSKEKVDHLRYKVEGDFVKVYITPFKTTISENDLEFSHGDVNVDLVISLNVTEEEDLDAALSEYGRIMHDASAINISNGKECKLRGVKWNEIDASSISEMVVRLADELKQEMTAEIATALLTGIEAATERFSNNKTTPEALAMSSKLMEAGADQQLIVTNITKKEEPAPEPTPEQTPEVTGPVQESAPISEQPTPEPTPEEQLEQMIAAAVPQVPTMPEIPVSPEEMAPAAVPVTPEPAVPDSPVTPESPITPEPAISEPVTPEPVVPEPVVPEPEAPSEQIAAVPTVEVPVDQVYQTATDHTNIQDGVMTPLEEEKPKDYAAMMEEELAEPAVNPAVIATPIVSEQPLESTSPTQPLMGEQPAAPITEQPAVPTIDLPPAPAPNVNDAMLPPVQMPPVQVPTPTQTPTPGPVDESSLQGMPATAEGDVTEAPAEPVNPVVVQPDPTAFHIPGM